MRTVSSSVACFVLLLLLFACGHSGAPDCDNNDVQSKVLDTIVKDFKARIESIYQQEKEKVSEQEKKEVFDKMDIFTNSFKLTGIRPTSKDDNIKECKCEADLSFEMIDAKDKSVEKTPVKYTAQRTTDGLLVKITDRPNWQKSLGLPLSAEDVKGEYVAEQGGVLVNFKSDGIVEINGTPYPYEIKGKAITVKEGKGKEETFIAMDDGTLQLNAYGMKLNFRKKN